MKRDDDSDEKLLTILGRQPKYTMINKTKYIVV